MRLKENPFYVLGVTPEQSIAEIDEVKEDKCFADETREAEYEEARDILANPRKRLSAEVRWYYEKNSQVFSGIDSLYALRDGHSAKEISEIIQRIDSVYVHVADPTAGAFLFNEICSGRMRAGMAQIDTQNAVTDALREAIAEDFRNAAAALCGQIFVSNLIQIANTLANDVIRPSLGVFPKKYDEIVRIFIDLYHAQMQNQLEDDCRKILVKMGKVREAEENLGSLYIDIRKFKDMANPLLLYFRDIGQIKRQKEMQEIEGDLRSLSLYYNNEKGWPNLSMSVTKFCLSVFADDPEFVEVLQDDKKVLEKLVKTYEQRKAEVEEVAAEEGEGNKIGCYIFLVLIIVFGFFACRPSSVSEGNKSSVSTSVKKEVNTPQAPVTSKEEEIRYVEPPVGNGRILSDDEMHWVAREQIRIEKMRELVQTNEGIDELNRRIDYYNARGGHFRYKRFSWDYAKEAVEKHRAEIEAEIEEEVIANGWD